MLGFGLGLGLTFNPTEGKRSLASMLFGGGEDGFLFGDFSELPELFQNSIGTANVSADGQTVGMALDDRGWGGQSYSQIVAAATEIRGTGTTGLLGAATAATYDTGTGAGSVARVDIGNQSFVSIAVDANGTYIVDVENTGASALNIRQGPPTGSIHQTISGGVRQTIIVQNATSALTFAANANASSTTLVVHSVKRIPGNSAVQITSLNRPLWKANAGKPYLLFDGSNDALIQPFLPMASGTGLTMAIAFNSTQGAVQTIPMGGGSATDRALIAIIANGSLGIGWGSQVNRGSNVVDLRNANHVVLVTGEASNRDIWLDGTNITADFAAAVGTPASNGGPIAIGGRQAAVGGAVDQNMPGNIYAACGLNRRVTPTEIARITAEFQRTF